MSDGTLEPEQVEIHVPDPAVAVGDESWFLDTDWQAGESEVDALVASDSVIVTNGVDEFLQSLPNSQSH